MTYSAGKTPKCADRIPVLRLTVQRYRDKYRPVLTINARLLAASLLEAGDVVTLRAVPDARSVILEAADDRGLSILTINQATASKRVVTPAYVDGPRVATAMELTLVQPGLIHFEAPRWFCEALARVKAAQIADLNLSAQANTAAARTGQKVKTQKAAKAVNVNKTRLAKKPVAPKKAPAALKAEAKTGKDGPPAPSIADNSLATLGRQTNSPTSRLAQYRRGLGVSDFYQIVGPEGRRVRCDLKGYTEETTGILVWTGNGNHLDAVMERYPAFAGEDHQIICVTEEKRERARTYFTSGTAADSMFRRAGLPKGRVAAR